MSEHKPLFCSAGSGYSELVTGFVVVVIAAAVVFICVVVICVVVGIGIVVICVGVGVIWDVVAVVIVCIVVIAADVVICVGVIVISGVVVVCDIVVVGFVDGLLEQSTAVMTEELQTGVGHIDEAKHDMQASLQP